MLRPAKIIAPAADSRPGAGAPDARPSWPTGLETAVGSIFATLLILGGGIAGASLASEPRRHGLWDTALFSAALLGWILLDIPYLGRLHLERRRLNPEALVTLAISQRRLSPAFRPLVAIWWLSHFAFACGFVVLQEYLGVAGMRIPDRIIVTVFASVLSFGGSYAANGFLAMAIGAITTRESVIRAVWSRRILIDAAIALVPLITVGM